MTYPKESYSIKSMNTEEFNKAVKPLSDKWTDDLVTHPAQITKNNQLDEDILELCKGTDDAIREKIIKYIESNNQVPEKIQSLAEDILKLHRPDPQNFHHESSCRKCNSTEIDRVVAKQKEEIDKLKKELDNSKFGSQCIVHELEYDKKTLIKENLELKENAERIGVNRYRQLCEAETENTSLKAKAKWLELNLGDCWDAANTFDGNYRNACEKVMSLVCRALNPPDKFKIYNTNDKPQ